MRTIRLMRGRVMRDVMADRRHKLMEWGRTIRGERQAYVYWRKVKGEDREAYGKGGVAVLIGKMEERRGIYE